MYVLPMGKKYIPLMSHSCEILKRKTMSPVKIVRSYKCAYIRERNFKMYLFDSSN